MTSLLKEIAAAEEYLDQLKRRAAHATCVELGSCDMRSIGGCNCGCDGGNCSVPVLQCARCGDSDYGDNDEATEIRRRCSDE